MSENLFPKAITDLINCLENNETYWRDYLAENPRILGFSPELRDLLCAAKPEKTELWNLLTQPSWEELIESNDPVLLQQAAYLAELNQRPFLADSFVALANVLEEVTVSKIPKRTRPIT